MVSLQRILLPVDFSAGSRVALDEAMLFAEHFSARIEVLHVWGLPPAIRGDLMVWLEGSGGAPVNQVIEEQVQAEMSAFLSHLPTDQRARVSERIESGDPVVNILELARSGAYDLIVLGTHGRTGFGHVLLGSVAQRVVREAPCPVLTVRLPPRA
jgi:universal stress protein A